MRPDSSFDQTGTSVNKHVNLFIESTESSGGRRRKLALGGFFLARAVKVRYY